MSFVVAQFQIAVLAVAVGVLLAVDCRGGEAVILLGGRPVVDGRLVVREAGIGFAVLHGGEIVAHASCRTLVYGHYAVVVQRPVGRRQNQHTRAPRVVTARFDTPLDVEGHYAAPRQRVDRSVVQDCRPGHVGVVLPRGDEVDVRLRIDFRLPALHADVYGVDRLLFDRVRVDRDRLAAVGVRVRFARHAGRRQARDSDRSPQQAGETFRQKCFSHKSIRLTVVVLVSGRRFVPNGHFNSKSTKIGRWSEGS